MGYFQAKYDSRAVIHNHRAFIRLTTGLPSQAEYLFNRDRIRFEALLGQRLASIFCEERFYHFQDLIFRFKKKEVVLAFDARFKFALDMNYSEYFFRCLEWVQLGGFLLLSSRWNKYKNFGQWKTRFQGLTQTFKNLKFWLSKYKKKVEI